MAKVVIAALLKFTDFARKTLSLKSLNFFLCYKMAKNGGENFQRATARRRAQPLKKIIDRGPRM